METKAIVCRRTGYIFVLPISSDEDDNCLNKRRGERERDEKETNCLFNFLQVSSYTFLLLSWTDDRFPPKSCCSNIYPLTSADGAVGWMVIIIETEIPQQPT